MVYGAPRAQKGGGINEGIASCGEPGGEETADHGARQEKRKKKVAVENGRWGVNAEENLLGPAHRKKEGGIGGVIGPGEKKSPGSKKKNPPGASKGSSVKLRKEASAGEVTWRRQSCRRGAHAIVSELSRKHKSRKVDLGAF